MPSNISAALEAHLAGDSITVCLLIKLIRTDGVVQGFAAHDTNITFGGLTYLASDGVSSSAIDSKVGTGVNNLDLEGALDSSQITESNLNAGLYQGARVEIRMVNFEDLTMGAKFMLSGLIGETVASDGQFRAEVRSLSELLKQIVGIQTTKSCPARLGDARCKVNMAGNAQNGFPIRANRTVTISAGLSLTFGSDSAPDTHYRYGVAKATTGQNAGIAMPIKAHVNSAGSAAITLKKGFPFPVLVGDQFQLEAGCDGLWVSCGTRFANKNNFHGQPFIPGNDKVSKVGRQ